MANNILILLKLEPDTIAFLSLIASTVGVVLGLVSAVAAVAAALYSRKAAMKNASVLVDPNIPPDEHFSDRILNIGAPGHHEQRQDDSPPPTEPEISPAPAEPETSPVPAEPETSPALNETSRVQVQQEASAAEVEPNASQDQPRNLTISVAGEAIGEVPLELFLTVQDPSVRVSRVVMLGEHGKPFGSSPCKPAEGALVFKSILSPDKVRRWWDAGDSTSDGEARAVLRVYMLLNGTGKEDYRDMPVSIVEGLKNVGIATLVVWTIKGSI